MDMEFLGDSTCIDSAGFKSGYLCIQFQDGTMYTYSDVEPSTWRGLKMSVSKGFYFNKYIRNNYSFFEGQPPDDGPLKFIDQKYFESLEEGAEEI